ncbi:amyloid protein-binding protein 2-like [Tetranychus urticae]|uniref:Amyloid protein-binding protein 2 n=1 Tax=Tetranychus urticae TaxID=32264 RepID=T1KDE3_TETUR|nr:amyloid protein-binding protein 2-like [Tetranychus urticae]
MSQFNADLSPGRPSNPCSGSSSASRCYFECCSLKLYNICLKSIVSSMKKVEYNLHCLPVRLQIDLYLEMFMNEHWNILGTYLSNLNNFVNLVMFNEGQRQTLHMLLQRLMDEGFNLTNDLCKYMAKDVASLLEAVQKSNSDSTLLRKSRIRSMKRGFALAGFLMEAGWYVEAERILSTCLTLYLPVIDTGDSSIEPWTFRIKTRLLGSLVSYSRFKEATVLYDEMLSQIEVNNYENRKDQFDVAQAYSQFACLFAAQSLYKEAYKWSCKALEHISPWTPRIALIDILLTAGRSCVIKRDFESADYLLRQALLVAKEMFNLDEKCDFQEISRFHPIVGDLLIAMGYYYHNVDLLSQSVKLYLYALNFRKQYFGPHTLTEQCINLPLALARQDLAFEYYIQEYSTGHFDMSLYHIELAKMSLETLLPPDHHLLTNVLRIKALIIEEIAIDNMDMVGRTELLMDAHKLHRRALDITKSLLGEENLQTAKHYSNLGRLYQSMHRYEDSEVFQLLSIEIKEKCLGKDDYEVAQSYGFLASLYCYDMELYPQAENYYLKAIEIGTKVFGGAYSGLEFEYQGIITIYTRNGEDEKAQEYIKLFRSWKAQRDSMVATITQKNLFTSLSDESPGLLNLEEIKKHFFSNRLHQI